MLSISIVRSSPIRFFIEKRQVRFSSVSWSIPTPRVRLLCGVVESSVPYSHTTSSTLSTENTTTLQQRYYVPLAYATGGATQHKVSTVAPLAHGWVSTSASQSLNLRSVMVYKVLVSFCCAINHRVYMEKKVVTTLRP